MNDISEMHVHYEYFNLLVIGLKTVEFRLNDEKRQEIKVGDKVRFICQNERSNSLVLSVTKIEKSTLFSSLVNNVEKSSLGGISPEEQIKELEKIYNKTREVKYGVLALSLERES